MEDDRAQTDLGLAADIEDLQIRPDDPPPEDAPPKQPRRRFVGRREAAASAAAAAAAAGTAAPPPGDSTTTTTSVQGPKPPRPPRLLNQVPPELRDDPVLRDALDLLPANYNFEVPKTIHRIRTLASRRVALQLPEGLLLFATTLADILAQFCPSLEEPPMVMGDMTYGACCIDDYTARALGCDLLIHYGHSCLIPVNVTTGIKILYVFVDIGIETGHLLETVTRNLDAGSTIALVGTIQFNATIHGVRAALERAGFRIVVPQVAPLSRGEILGCTSPRLPADDGIDSILYLGDGRFHLESIMIHNPDLPAYRYDPYNRRMTREWYGHAEMHDVRRGAIRTARGARKWGLILGSLGRQGNPHTLALVEAALARRAIPFLNLVLSEITPAKLALLSDVDCWVQVACPRISIDWGYTYPRPLLNPYEALVALGEREDWADGPYPMDYYGRDGLGRAVAAGGGEGGQAVA